MKFKKYPKHKPSGDGFYLAVRNHGSFEVVYFCNEDGFITYDHQPPLKGVVTGFMDTQLTEELLKCATTNKD